jgi:hypothetical protein
MTGLFGSDAFCTSKQTSFYDLFQHISCGTLPCTLGTVSSRFSVRLGVVIWSILVPTLSEQVPRTSVPVSGILDILHIFTEQSVCNKIHFLNVFLAVFLGHGIVLVGSFSEAKAAGA